MKKLPISREDFMASLVVFIVAVPLSLGIAMASGVSPLSGLVSAIIGGVLVGILSGAPLMVSGPAAGLTVLVFQIVQAHGVTGLMWATLIAGLIQILFGVLRWGNLFRLVPESILQGMLAAIGLIIVLGQMHVMVGSGVPKSPIEAFFSFPEVLATQWGIDSSTTFWIIALGTLGIAIQAFWHKINRWASWIPGALPAVILVTVLSLGVDMPRIEISSWQDAFRLISPDDVSVFTSSNTLMIFGFGLALAVVASAESLLTARATDVLAKNENVPHKSDLNKEVIAQGVGNSVSAILGGLPVTGVIVRSSANIQNGGRTRWAAILHGAWVLVFIVLFPAVLAKVPLVALASVLIVVGAKLLNPFKASALFGPSGEGWVWLGTLVFIVRFDLLTGLALGGLFALVQHQVSRYMRKRAGASSS